MTTSRPLCRVVKREAEGAAIALARVAPGSVVHADEATHWDAMEATFVTQRINHSLAYSLAEACTNQAESYFYRLRRAAVGQHHHVGKQYLFQYANEAASREDHDRLDNKGQHVAVMSAAFTSPVSRQWNGYCQRTP